MRLIDADVLMAVAFGTMRSIVEDIEDAEEIDAEPVRHGRWIPNFESITPLRTKICEECSLCGRTVLRYVPEPANKFCPNCGAKMDLEVHDENA